MTIKEFFSFRANRFFWLNLLAMPVVLVLLVWGTLRWLDAYTHHGEAVAVPDVKHKPLAEAQQLLAQGGLQSVVADSTYVKTLPPGCVLEYNPAVGQRVKRGRIVYLTVNTRNVPLVELPDVADNSSLREAEARLLAAGFKLMPNDTVPGERDWVYGVKHEGRLLGLKAEVPQGAYLTIVVGDGQVHTEIVADTLAGDSLGLRQEEVKETGAADESWF